MEWGPLLGGLLTLAILSYLWRENPVYRLAEHIFIAIATSYSLVVNYDTLIKPTITNDIIKGGRWDYALAAILGLLIYTRYFPKIAWISRYPMSFWVGYGAGYVLSFAPAPLIKQINDSFVKFAVTDKAGALQFGPTVNNILFFLMLIAAMTYFFFTIRRDYPAVGYTASLGRWAIMIGLGAAFGNTVMARISLFLGRLQFLFGDWLHLIK